MARLMLIVFIALELSYYLLIVQTGIVEYFSSDIFLIAPLPIGGIIGSLLSFYIKANNQNKITFFLTLQLLLSFLYPNLSQMMLFVLGISAGALAPLMINELKKAKFIDLGIALSISYTIGTLLFNYEASQRGTLAIVLSSIILISSMFLPKTILQESTDDSHSLSLMLLWVFLDSALFESLSRDLIIPIWRGGFSYEIAFFHIVGIVLAVGIKMPKKKKELLIASLFALSYLFYFLQEAYILSAIYPIVISYYNITILQSLLKRNLKIIGTYMILIGWVASGIGLFVALENLIIFIPIIFSLLFLDIPKIQNIHKKEIHNV